MLAVICLPTNQITNLIPLIKQKIIFPSEKSVYGVRTFTNRVLVGITTGSAMREPGGYVGIEKGEHALLRANQGHNMFRALLTPRCYVEHCSVLTRRKRRKIVRLFPSVEVKIPQTETELRIELDSAEYLRQGSV